MYRCARLAAHRTWFQLISSSIFNINCYRRAIWISCEANATIRVRYECVILCVCVRVFTRCMWIHTEQSTLSNEPRAHELNATSDVCRHISTHSTKNRHILKASTAMHTHTMERVACDAHRVCEQVNEWMAECLLCLARLSSAQLNGRFFEFQEWSHSVTSCRL